jgi:predicted metal-binding membrane protein
LEKTQQATLLILPSQGAIAHTWRHLIGLLVSAEKQVPFGRTHMRSIQWGLASQWKISREHLRKWVKLTPLAALHMKW